MNENETRKIDELPRNDSDFWDGEKILATNTSVPICLDHTKDSWAMHEGYIDNKDGTISCKFCPWGALLPGYMRVLDGKIIDLRTFREK